MQHTFDIENNKEQPSNKSNSNGLFIQTKYLILIGILTALIFTGSILATYFGKSCQDCDKLLSNKCGDFYCSNINILDEWNRICPASTTLPTTSPLPATTPTIPTTPSESTTPIATTTTTPIPPEPEYRLTGDLYPYHYDLTLWPYFKISEEPEFFDAKIKINFRCVKATNKLALHMLDLDLDEDTLVIESATNDFEFTPIRSPKWTYDEITDILTFDLEDQMFKVNENYTFLGSFRGYSDDSGAGFYKGSFFDENGEERWYITSQLQAIEARKAFLCFDEPGFKSTFKISIYHDESLKAMSNMPITSVKKMSPSGTNKVDIDNYDWVLTEFDESVPMSVYLVAILISDFDCRLGMGDSKAVTGVCSRSDAVEELELALESSIELLDFFEEYTGIDYPIQKLDHVGVNNFLAGAMENWGLALYAERYFLYDRDSSTQTDEYNVVTIIAHETAHQWVGNLVTSQWWDDLWLNEGFATFFEYISTDSIHKNWRMWDEYLADLFNIMQTDSNQQATPISVDRNSQYEIDNVFNYATYGKASGIVRMALYVLGYESFRSALSKYLNNFAYQNTVQNNLWDAFYEEAVAEGLLDASVDFSKVMSPWTKQKGFPVITIRRIGNNQIGIKQNRFIFNTLVDIDDLKDTKWSIPFTHSVETLGSTNSFTNLVTMSNLRNKVKWLDPEKEEEILNLDRPLGANDFFIANLDMAGFYRVNYDAVTWRLIIEQLINHKDQLSVKTRAQLITDVFSLTEANYVNSPAAFELASYMSNELDFLPWSALLNRINFFLYLFDSTASYGNIQTYLSDLVGPYYRKLGWIENLEKDDWNDRFVRNRIITFACRRDLPECLTTATEYFRYWVETGDASRIPRGYRSLVLCTGVNQGTPSDFNFVLDQSKKTTGSLRTDLEAALACSKDSLLQTRYLDDQLRNTTNILRALINVVNRPNGFVTSWNFLKANWDEIYASNSRSSNFPVLIRSLSLRLKYQYELDDVANFFDGKVLTSAIEDALDVAVELIQSNIKWYSRNSQIMINWFNIYEPLKPQLINFRLPDNLEPTLYDLTLQPFIGPNPAWPTEKDYTFEATMHMHFTCRKPTTKIIFHSLELVINQNALELTSNDDNGIGLVGDLEFDQRREFVIVNMNRECKMGSSYVLKIEFTGIILPVLYGFYRSSYLDANSVRKYLAVTKFQPTSARRAFPCMDEPAIKAPFKLTLIRHKSHPSTFFNTPLNDSIPLAGTNEEWFTDYFGESPKMSTYLAAYAITDFETISETSDKGVVIEISARPQAIQAGEGQYALEEALDMIDFFADYFDVDYPLEKSTQIAIPDFNSGAMENWGLVTYREESLLYNPNRDQITNKRRVSTVVSHELAHQWFGNLVTCEWWNDLWLNEGFASWVEYLGYNFTHSEWRDLEFFFTQRLGPFVSDSLESSHPISVEVNDPAEINSLFDAISYSKGASIIRMMNAFLTENTFRKGVSNYLKKFEYDSAKQDDLWESLTEQAHDDGTLERPVTVKDIMDTWTLKKGYPIVTITRNARTLNIKQRYFLLNPLNSIQNTPEYDTYKWYIAFTYTTKDELDWDFEKTPNWFMPKDPQLNIEMPSETKDDSWYIGNIQHSGWYRVDYDQNNWNLLIEQLNTDHKLINPVHRAQLLDDSFNLGRAEIKDQLLFFNITRYLADEEDGIAFVPTFNGFSYMTSLVEDDFETIDLYGEYYKSILQKTYDRLGWDETLEDANQINLQTSTLSVMCSFGNQDCVNQAKAFYNDWLNNDTPLPVNFKNIIYSTAIQYGDEAVWRRLYDIALRTLDNAEKLRMLRGLAASKDYSLLKFFLYKTADPVVVRPQDRVSLIGNIAANVVSRRLAYDYMEENWDEFYDLYGSISFTLPNLVTSCTSRLNKPFDLRRVENFFKTTPNIGVATEAFKNALETIRTNIRWTEKNMKPLNNWLISEIGTPRNQNK